MPKSSFTIPLTPEQLSAAATLLRTGNYAPLAVPYTVAAASTADCRIMLYSSGKCLVQGRGAENWIRFVLEPEILHEARLGYEEQLDPAGYSPHIGVDESGKGDFFGPLVIAGVYVDAPTARDLVALGARDSKSISDGPARALARQLRERLADRFTVVTIGPAAYNRLYATMGSVNRILAWGHAKCIENLLEKVPDCPRALSDQFGPPEQIRRALLQKGRKIQLDQRPRAESDPAVAAASVIARDAFLAALARLSADAGLPLPKGATAAVVAAAASLAQAKGGASFLDFAKAHFKTADDALAKISRTRATEGLPPASERRPFIPRRPSPPPP
ncbi:MAG: ribonuclease HIII [Kiritimatiellae bacterium]|nr:ribonuclease HIII [Kiritimatiellia bacterium]